MSSGPTMLVPRSEREEVDAAEWELERARLDHAYQAAWDRSGRGWTVWQPTRATGSNGPELRPETDGSFRVVGQSPIYSTYVLEGEPGVQDLAGLRLEVLPDGGPGRSGNRNFVLQELRVERLPAGSADWEPLELAAARADFEQNTAGEGGHHYAVAGALPRSGLPGWAIKPAFDAPPRRRVHPQGPDSTRRRGPAPRRAAAGARRPAHARPVPRAALGRRPRSGS